MRRRNFLAALVALPFVGEAFEKLAANPPKEERVPLRISDLPLRVTTGSSGGWVMYDIVLRDGGYESTMRWTGS